MIESKQYGDKFFQDMEMGSLRSARAVLPLVDDFFHPNSIIDVGCGTAVWLSVWENELKKDKIIGIEGPYVDKAMLKVSPAKVLFQDLKQQIGVNEKFDLAVCLEVAEHLPSSYAEKFAGELTRLSDVILFSAAIPGQGGTYHINEQYPEYWAEIFSKYDFIPVDCIRPLIWNNKSVEFWYKQNILVFIKKDVVYNYTSLESYLKATYPNYLARIHPDFFDSINEHMRRTFSLPGFLNWKWYLFKKKYLKRNGGN